MSTGAEVVFNTIVPPGLAGVEQFAATSSGIGREAVERCTAGGTVRRLGKRPVAR